MDRLLKINLTTRKIKVEELPQDIVWSFMGGRALGAYLMYKSIPRGIDPLGPENRIFFTVGPLQGTAVPSSGRYNIMAKSPQTGIYGYASSGGPFGIDLGKTGYLAVEIEGRAEEPVYVSIIDDQVDIREASMYWGMNTGDTQEFMKKMIGEDSISIACIGPAGENLVPYAAVVSERRTASRSGMAAVMGSKNLKALVVKGSQSSKVIDPKGLREAIKKALQEGKDSAFGKALRKYGTPVASAQFNTAGIVPVKNFREASNPNIPLMIGENALKFKRKTFSCAGPCPVQCSKINVVGEGPYKGTSQDGPEYDAFASFGPITGTFEMAPIIRADYLCDQYGLDSISTGVTLAFAMECFERGFFTMEDTDGLELRWGNHSVFEPLIRNIALREGFGALLALGTKGMSEKIGQGSERFAMHCKGMELGSYDPRAVKGMALVYAVGPRGGCHHAGGYTIAAEAFDPKVNRFADRGKAEIVRLTRNRGMIWDSAAVCRFPSRDWPNASLAAMVKAVTNVDWTDQSMMKMGEKASDIERAFNVREGIRRADDTLPKRLLEETVPTGSSKDSIVDLSIMLDEFYAVCGWDIQTGIPTRAKLESEGLGFIADDLW